MNKPPFMAWWQGLHSNGEVLAWDPEEQEWYPVTGATYDGHEIQLYPDEDCENSTGNAVLCTQTGCVAAKQATPQVATLSARGTSSTSNALCWPALNPLHARYLPSWKKRGSQSHEKRACFCARWSHNSGIPLRRCR
jgi:hypothetical protein